jgi:mitogen-activated protein kinase 1/3
MQPYTCSIDLWSFGCIFAEFLMAASPSKELKVLFAGKSCFPKSPTKKDVVIEAGTKKHYMISYDDQLNKIFDIIGTPSEDDMSWIEEENVKEYVRSFPPRKKTDLREMI